ncbi:hypothetical protein BKA62DRAFT_820527 [Auriculariales sp. MPI-PUGE-AT-0066]|nr:hypothetical protein BKA62DRAFT_820527 [Auriculariales sp. MPI-PUGE-AT-0066]
MEKPSNTQTASASSSNPSRLITLLKRRWLSILLVTALANACFMHKQYSDAVKRSVYVRGVAPAPPDDSFVQIIAGMAWIIFTVFIGMWDGLVLAFTWSVCYGILLKMVPARTPERLSNVLIGVNFLISFALGLAVYLTIIFSPDIMRNRLIQRAGDTACDNYWIQTALKGRVGKSRQSIATFSTILSKEILFSFQSTPSRPEEFLLDPQSISPEATSLLPVLQKVTFENGSTRIAGGCYEGPCNGTGNVSLVSTDLLAFDISFNGTTTRVKRVEDRPDWSFRLPLRPIGYVVEPGGSVVTDNVQFSAFGVAEKCETRLCIAHDARKADGKLDTEVLVSILWLLQHTTRTMRCT